MKLKKFRIVYLINGLGPGGAEMMLYRLLERLDRKAFRPVVIALLNISGPLQEKIEELGVGVHIVGVKSKLDMGALIKLYRLLKELSPDVLHTQLYAADIVGRIMGRILKIPVVITSIRNIYYGNIWRNLLIKWTEKYSDRTTFVSEAAARRFVRLKVVPNNKPQVIYNGLDPDAFYSGLSDSEKLTKRVELKLPLESFLLLSVGSLTVQKGYKDLFKALGRLQANAAKLKFSLIVVGRGLLKNELKKQAEEIGLLNKVVFIGHSDNVPALMAAADALVLSSLWEGLPGVVMEAMASELPVVATAVGGTPELILNNETGYLVPVGVPERLAKALENILLLSAEERKKMGEVGRDRVKKHFHIDKMVKAYENLYYETLREKNKY